MVAVRNPYGPIQAVLQSLLSIEGTDLSVLPTRELKENLSQAGYSALSLGNLALQTGLEECMQVQLKMVL